MSLFIITGGKAMCKLLLESFTFAGLKGSLYECQPESLRDIIAHKDFYIRKTLDTRHAEELAKSLKEGEDLPPVVVCTVKEISQKRIINGNHTAYAHILAQKPVKVLDIGELSFEDAFKLQSQLNHQGKILSIKPEDIKHYAQLLYRSFRSEVLGKRDRNTAIQKVALILSKTERMVYNYLADILKQEDEELRKRALELYQQGKTQDEIAKELGIAIGTVNGWLNSLENTSQVKTPTKQFSIFEIISKSENLSPSHSTLMKPSLNNLNGEFLKLLNTYFESGNQRLTGFYDWAKEKGYEISKEEWDEFRRQVEFALRRVLILNIRKMEKEIKLLMERELQVIPRPAREWIIGSYWELVGPRMLKEAKAFEGLIREVCEDLEIEDILGELRKRAEKRDLVYVKQNFNLFVAVYEDVINKCKEKYPVLRLEDIEDRLENLIELESKEEIEKELKAEFVNYRVPKAIVEEIWKSKTEKIRAELLQRARAIKDYGEFKDWLNSLQGHQKELFQNISEIREIEKALKEKHDREVLQRLVEEIKSLKHMDYASLVESLSEEDKDVAIRYRKELERVFAELKRPKAEDVERLIEEGLSDEDIISHFRTLGLYLPLQELSKIKQAYLKRKEEELKKIEEERKRKEEELRRAEEELRKREEEIKRIEEEKQNKALSLPEEEIVYGQILEEDEWIREFLEDEDDEKMAGKGIGIKGFIRAVERYRKHFQKYLETIEKMSELYEKGQIKDARKLKEQVKKLIEQDIKHADATIEKAKTSLEKRKKVSNPLAVKYAYRALQMWLEEYRRFTGMELSERDKKRGMAEFIRLFDEYLERMPPKEFMEVFKKVMEAQFARVVRGNLRSGLAYLTPSDLVLNFARYVPVALYDRVVEEHTRRTIDYIEDLLNGGSA